MRKTSRVFCASRDPTPPRPIREAAAAAAAAARELGPRYHDVKVPFSPRGLLSEFASEERQSLESVSRRNKKKNQVRVFRGWISRSRTSPTVGPGLREDVRFHPKSIIWCPFICHDPYLPSVPASLQALGRFGCAVAFSITPRDPRVASPRVITF